MKEETHQSNYYKQLEEEPCPCIAFPPESLLAVIFYSSHADGLESTWEQLLSLLPVNMEDCFYYETTHKSNGVLLYRHSGTSEHYIRLASTLGRDVLAKYDENTFFVQSLLERLPEAGANSAGLRALSEYEERFLLDVIRRVAGRNGLDVP